MAVLYIVATPIGNLSDITSRAIEVLREVDLILCEDTRVTKKLLARYGIRTPTLSYFQHSKLRKATYILEILEQGKDLALVSDAGTPGISDPGGKLIETICKSYSQKKRSLFLETKIVPIPGPSALIAAASISGFPMDKFIFLGFPPTKRKRKKFFTKIAKAKYPVIFYESPHRIIKTLKELKNSLICDDRINEYKREIVVCRELTKKFETTYRGKIKEVIEKLEKGKVKGEFVVIVNKS